VQSATAPTARKIKASPKGVTGRVGAGKEFEFLLELDFLLLLQFDLSVSDFTCQPLRIDYEFEGKRHVYTPDVLVHYRPLPDGARPRSILVEVKPENHIDDDQSLQAAKFAAAERICGEREWQFLVVTDRQIRTGRLENAKFFNRFLRRSVDAASADQILQALKRLGPSTPAQLLQALCRDDAEKSTLLPELWTMLAHRRIQMDFGQPISMSTTILTGEASWRRTL
jgi:hypothetical protein